MKKMLAPADIVRAGLCIGCGSCVAQSDAAGVQMKFDKYGQLKPGGNNSWYKSRCESFTRSCPFSTAAKNEDELGGGLFSIAKNHHVALGNFQQAYVGHVAEATFREQGSSGGMVTWVATELFRKGLIDGVAHVIATENPPADGRFFRYRISRTEDEISEGAKSRYYPVDLSAVLKMIKEVPGRYAVVGIPCFIKAIQLMRQEDAVIHDRIRFTLGLFCGHMKSARFVESFAWQMKVPITSIKKVEYRYKDPSRPANQYTAMFTLNNNEQVKKDWWHLADGDWGGGFFMNAACNFCDDVVAETADISFGDAWVEPYSSDGRGTNVVVIRSGAVQQIVADAISQKQLKLDEVDGDFVAQTQAAGLRQRREGLAYRLTWKNWGVKPVKRVTPDAITLTTQRKIIYRMRYLVSLWSHRIFWLARTLHLPGLYIGWSRIAGSVYHGLAYHKGKMDEMIKRFKEFKK